MAAEAWSQETLSAFGKSLDQLPGANVYLIDVGASEPKDIGLGGLKLSSERVAPGGLLQLNTDLLATGAAGKDSETPVELYVGDGANKPEKRGQQMVALNGEQPSSVEFSLSGLKVGT